MTQPRRRRWRRPTCAGAERPCSTPAQQGSGIRLVAYTGKQPAGFLVDQTPQGWYIQPQDHASYTLTIAPDPDGRYVQVQAWDNLGWNDDQLVHFAEGVTVTSDAKAGSG